MVNVALIGFGWWGKNLAKAMEGENSKIRLAMIVTKEMSEAADYCKANEITLSNELNDALSNPQIEAIVLATPHSMHSDQIAASARAGKHVFCEKPLALRYEDAVSAIQTCKDHHLILAVGQNKRFWPSMAKLREVVGSGSLGTLMHIEGHYSNEHSTKFFSDWRDKPNESPAGGLTGTGIHIIDAMVNLAGKASQVSAHVASFRSGKDPRDATSVNVQFENGVSGYFAMVRATPLFWRLHAFGDAGSVEAIGETECIIRRNGNLVDRFTYPAVDSIQAELDAFANSILSNGEIPYPISTKEMGQTIGLFEAIVQSVNTKSTVNVHS